MPGPDTEAAMLGWECWRAGVHFCNLAPDTIRFLSRSFPRALVKGFRQKKLRCCGTWVCPSLQRHGGGGGPGPAGSKAGSNGGGGVCCNDVAVRDGSGISCNRCRSPLVRLECSAKVLEIFSGSRRVAFRLEGRHAHMPHRCTAGYRSMRNYNAGSQSSSVCPLLEMSRRAKSRRELNLGDPVFFGDGTPPHVE
jgi:hypothetical protein